MRRHACGDARRRYVDTGSRTGRPTTTRCPRENANGEGALSNEASRDPDRPRRAGSSRCRPSTPSTAQREPARRTPGAGRTASTARRRDGPLHDLERARLLEDDDLHRLAQRQPSTAPTSRSGRDSRRFRARATPIRLYARLQQPGTSTYDGYMLRTNQLAGTDQVFLERVDNGAIVSRLTVNQELAAGDVVLLRAKGSTIELWRSAGTAWSRLGVVTDTTYAAVGFAGVGLRGTTGRLDDFGARSLSAEPTAAPRPRSRRRRRRRSSVSLSWTAPSLRRRLAGHGLQGVPRHEPGRRRASIADAGIAARRYVDAGAVKRHDLLLQGVRARTPNGEGPLSNEVSATPTGVVPPVEPLPTARRLQPRQREPALGRRRAGRTGSTARSRPASTSPPTRSPARRRRPVPPGATPPSTAPTSRSWARHLDAAGHEQRASPVRAPAAAGHVRLRRLHAAHEPARGDGRGLPRARRQRRASVNLLT